ncbi:hypothetical protein VP01_905g3, partial [Puccinia sorghi]
FSAVKPKSTQYTLEKETQLPTETFFLSTPPIALLSSLASKIQDLVAIRAYDHMNINPAQAKNRAILIQAYNHYLHWVLCDFWKEFAIMNKFPKRYQGILAQIKSYCNDEYDPKRKFFRQLELAMFNAAGEVLPGYIKIHSFSKGPSHQLLQLSMPWLFFPDAKESLASKQKTHPEEKLTDSSFTLKYWVILMQMIKMTPTMKQTMMILKAKEMTFTLW